MDDPVVIIGSGPSGAMAAHVLQRRGIRVLVLESGLDFPGGQLVRAFGHTVWKRQASTRESPEFTVSGDAETSWFADYAPGGLSNQWTGAVPRFSACDFTDGVRLGEHYAWPVSYDELQPYYGLSERVLQVSGARQDHPAVPAGNVAREAQLPADWRALARRAAGGGTTIMPAPLAAGPRWGAVRRSTPFNSYVRLLLPIVRREPGAVRLGAHATRLVWDQKRQRVSEVEYFDRRTHRQARARASAVVLACGAISTPRLLLNSTSSAFPFGLGNSNHLVGAYLHDHPHHMFAIETNRPLSRLAHIAHLTRAPYDGTPPLTAAQCTLGGRMSRADRWMAALPVKTNRLGVVVFGTMRPEPENRVTLSHERRDAFGVPVPDIKISFSERDLATAIDAEARVMTVFDELGLAPRLTWRLDRITPGSAVHFAGTARMHASPEHGVVDAAGRLHDCPNVVVADSSVFTTCVEKNPTLTAMALSARAADKLSLRVHDGEA
jgi:choline dehydrogenase-like flavoprotein